MRAVYILAGILIFGVLVAIHEFGHFAAAKLCGVKVNEFSIGMGPLLFRRTRGETQYSLRALPLGGFCAMEGEDGDSEDERALSHKNFWQQLLVFAAGPGMNFLLGFIIVLGLYAGAFGFYQDRLVGFAPEFTLEGENGLQVGDVFYKVDGYRTYLRGDASLLLSSHQGDTIDLVMLREGKKVVLKDFPMARRQYTDQNGQPYTGFGIMLGAEVIPAESVLTKVRFAGYTVADFSQQVLLGLRQMIAGSVSMEEVSGPVGIVTTITEVGENAETRQAAFEQILYLGALLAVNLGVMNLLPIPALDGGHILILALNALTMLLFRKKIPEKYQNIINTVFFALLMGFMLMITCQDVLKLIR